ncbi:MFS transporter [Microbacterium memoriense]|uniref:MFS transporter n=1 Tax=Microbacterium memoriense TaxID=2978350 RepID=A0ABT2PBU0_9MICO|nr:MFS transporter [Microbacterium memoriense]MCT9002057.1 MFS transporter [Microbacterium memoriense]
MLGTIADGFGVSTSTAGLLVTATQIGYAVGMFFLVPLGDIINRKRMIPAFMLLAAVMLAVSAFAPTFPVLLIALTIVGASTVSGQLLAPLAGDIAADDQRGRVLGTVASGILLGVMIARAISGIVTDLIGWRALYLGVAIVMLALAIVTHRSLPALPPRPRVAYGSLLRSVLRTYALSATARWVGLIGAAAMATFTLFWTGLTLLLIEEPFALSATQIGLINLIGIFGAAAALRVGRLYDRGLAVPAIGAGLALAIVGFVVAGLGASSLAAIIVAIAIYSIGIQSVMVLTQTRMLSVDPASRSRLNTVFVVGNFIGGSIGSALASLLWDLGGWTTIMITATGILALALLIWTAERQRTLAT